MDNQTSLPDRCSIKKSSSGGADYQLDLVMPGSSPACVISRRQIRQSPNFLNTAWARPHRWQRVYPRTANFGFAAALILSEVLAMT
jgi:hypothetical protein